LHLQSCICNLESEMLGSAIQHSWELDTAQARDLQLRLAPQVDRSRTLGGYETIAGADVSYNIRSPQLYAAVVVVRAGTWELIDRSGIVAEARFPYVPGLLSFRESPAVLEAFDGLKTRPDVLLCDGQGFAHPRRFGLACHVGLWLGLPTIGCAKSWLCGDFEEPGAERGQWSPLTDGGETIGAVLRTRSKVNPLFVSSGHLCDLESAIAVTLAACPAYRIPVPCRLAHQYVNELRSRAGV
jgi:deoxyribonuclease V